MENPTNITSAGSGPTLEYLGELVIQGFGNLKRKYDCKLTPAPTRTISVDGVNSREILCDRLRSTLLPLCKDQLTTILNLLEPASMQNEPESKLKRVLEIQPELDYNMTQINSAVLVICPESLSSSYDQTNDHHLKQLKAYRLLEFKRKFHALGSICDVFQAASQYMEVAPEGLSRAGRLFDDYKRNTKTTVNWIEKTIKHSNKTELDVIADCGATAVFRIDCQLVDLVSLIDPAAPPGYSDFEALTVLYLVPLINNLPEKDYYLDWFSTWNTQINIAVQNFVQLAKHLRQDDLA
ncbi:hypothetical protein PtA15_5A900 [Puccinia triticina]|uniref:VPS9 domain-containing protein n=1 Tax=Puccinia triticina TaxID=208348 RepID=A0ABY7CNF4_9BASI|nr:uncharacterized protein PtA15_5A900 [Puccinia triticina]WAQ85325.1 hypothetical protein PtA15_5A900 [Puccinia triticina]